MSVAPSAPARTAETPRSGTGVPCQIAQSDGVPCAAVRVDCEHCERSTTGVCDEYRDATGDAGGDAGDDVSRPTKANHA